MLLRRRTRSVLERSSRKGCNRSPSRLHTLRINATIKVARLIAGTRARVPRGRDGPPRIPDVGDAGDGSVAGRLAAFPALAWPSTALARGKEVVR
jgi:hypothetical protein